MYPAEPLPGSPLVSLATIMISFSRGPCTYPGRAGTLAHKHKSAIILRPSIPGKTTGTGPGDHEANTTSTQNTKKNKTRKESNNAQTTSHKRRKRHNNP